MYDEADKAVNDGIEFCEHEQLERKKQKLIYFKENHTRNTKPIMEKEDNLHIEKIRQITRHAAAQIQRDKREKDIKFLTALQEAVSFENMSVNDLYRNTSAVIKNSYNIDEIIILRRKNNKSESMIENSSIKLPDEKFDMIFDFFHSYKQAFLSNRTDKNFNQFLPVMNFVNEPIMTMIGIPIIEE